MTNYEGQETDVEQLMLRIRESVSRRGAANRYSRSHFSTATAGNVSTSSVDMDLPDLKFSSDFQPRKDNHYHVNDLLKYHDRDFVRNGYRAILGRAPDEVGSQGFLNGLRSGEINKIDVLAKLRYSNEGQERKVRIDGLKFPATVRRLGRVTVLGYFVQLVIGILRLPSSIRERRRFESYSLIQGQELAEHINRLAGLVRTLSQFVNGLPAKMENQRQELASLVEQHQQQLQTLLETQQNHIAAQATALSTHEIALSELSEATSELSEAAVTQKNRSEELNSQLLKTQNNLKGQTLETERLFNALQQVRAEVAAQQARAASLIEAVSRNAKGPTSSEQTDVFREEDAHLLDALYVSLEDRFRGEKSEVKQNFRFYLPYLKQAGVTMGILDVGCGRGEWLELLRDEGLQAKGIDLNRSMVEQSRSSDLEVVCGNAIDYLRTLPDHSFSAITSFHVIEHLDFKVLIELIDETVRVLKPGGLLILETPNPENVIVASCNFYLDPSHRRPLPSQVMRFLLEARGLTDLEVVGLHPLPSARIDGDTELIHRFNDIFYGPMDYAIIGRRA